MRVRSAAAVLTLALGVAGCASTAQRPADITQLSVVDAAQLIRDKKVTSVELTQAYLARAEANRDLNAFITLDRAGALAAAQRADADLAAGRNKGPAARRAARREGQRARGRPAQHRRHARSEGVRPARDTRPPRSELVDAGAVILGKTNMHELAFGISGYNEGFFTAQPIGTRNPYDRTRIAGGSSSGTGAAIGARLAPGGLGSDTGGSVRIPAALTGGVGLRPTIGRYSQEGVTPISHSRDTVGPMAQTVADVALLHSVIVGRGVPTPASVSGVKLGVYRAYFFKDLDPDTRAVTDAWRSTSSRRPVRRSSRSTCPICRS